MYHVRAADVLARELYCAVVLVLASQYLEDEVCEHGDGGHGAELLQGRDVGQRAHLTRGMRPDTDRREIRRPVSPTRCRPSSWKAGLDYNPLMGAG